MASLIVTALLFGCFIMASVVGLGLGLPQQFGIILAELLGFGSVVWFAYSRSVLPKRHLTRMGRPAAPAWRLALAALCAVPFALTANAMGGMVVALFPQMAEVAASYAEGVKKLLHPEQAWLGAVGYFSVCVSAPLFEELGFRGALMGALRDDTDAMKASFSRATVALICALNGLAFGAIHLSWLSIVPLSFFGAYLAHLTLRSNSIWPAIAAHATFNTFNAVIFPLLVTPQADIPSMAEAASTLGITGAAAALAWYASIRLVSTPTSAHDAP